MPPRSTLTLVLVLGAGSFAPSRALAQARLEVELAAGLGTAGSSSRLGTNSPYPWAPVVSGRVGVDLWNVFTPSLRIFGVAGPDGPGPGGASEYRAISGLLELRVHSPGTTQVYGGVGGGIGRVIGLQRTDAFESNTITSEAGPAFLAVLGLRHLTSPKVAIGGEVATSFWTGGEHTGNPGSCCTYQGGGPPESGLLVHGVSLLLSVTFLSTP